MGDGNCHFYRFAKSIVYYDETAIYKNKTTSLKITKAENMRHQVVEIYKGDSLLFQIGTNNIHEKKFERSALYDGKMERNNKRQFHHIRSGKLNGGRFPAGQIVEL